MPVSGLLIAVGSNIGRWGISPKTLKSLCPDAGSNPATKTKYTIRIIRSNLFKMILQNYVANNSSRTFKEINL